MRSRSVLFIHDVSRSAEGAISGSYYLVDAIKSVANVDMQRSRSGTDSSERLRNFLRFRSE